jgi:predicted alpha/beta superfamily hydrolase
LVEDTERFVNEVGKLYPPETPKFLFGYSFGCVLSNLISLKLANCFQGMVLIAPPFHHNVKFILFSSTNTNLGSR